MKGLRSKVDVTSSVNIFVYLKQMSFKRVVIFNASDLNVPLNLCYFQLHCSFSKTL